MRTVGSQRYTIDEIHYIEEHLDDGPAKIAAVLNRPLGTIKAYSRRIRQGTLKYENYKIVRYYAVYLRKTDELVCSGTADECAEYFGVARHTFYTMVCKVKHNKLKKWDIYVEEIDVEEEE